MSVEVSIEGLDKFLTICDPARFLKEMDKAVNHAAELLRDETKRMPPVSGPRDGYDAKGIPVDSGRMRQAVQKRRLALLAAEVYVPVQYSGFVHDGTSRIPSRPFLLWVLEDFGGKEKIQAIVIEALEKIAQP
jgi:hypothetical protein